MFWEEVVDRWLMLAFVLIMIVLLIVIVRRSGRMAQANRSLNMQLFEKQAELSKKQLELSERSSQSLLAILERMDQRIAHLENKP